MKVYILFFIFLMIHTMTAEKAMTKLLRKLIVPKLDDKCRKIKCASVDEPECVKMKRKDLGSDVHIIVVNKCELDYLKCHDDVEAKIVPMKFCSHNRRNSGKKIMKEKSHLRVKRRVFQRSRKDNNEENVTEKVDLFKGIEKLHKNGTINTKYITSKLPIWKNESSNIIPKETIKKVNSTEKIHREGDDISFQIEDDPETKMIHDEVVEKVADAEHLKYQQRKRKIKYLEVPLPLFSNENDLDETVKEPNLSEYNAVCPTVCPSRNVMVCARCQHGVYRSFISVCHMRMFDCNHDDEELELVSRNSCLLSAPYLSEDDMKPQGKVVEANDDDKILRYIICKQNKEIHGRYNKEDPRCKFPLVVEKSKYFYDYKGVAHPLDLYLLTNLTSLSDSENTAKNRYEMN